MSWFCFAAATRSKSHNVTDTSYKDITNATPTLQAWISTLLGFKTFRRSTLDASRFHAIRKRKTRRDLENAGPPPSGNDSARDLQRLKSNLPCHELWSIARPRFGSFLRSELTLAGVLIFVGSTPLGTFGRLKSNLPCHELWSIARPRFGSFCAFKSNLAGVLNFAGEDLGDPTTSASTARLCSGPPMCLKSNLLGITGFGGIHSSLGRASDPSWLGVEPCGVLSFVVRDLGTLVLKTRLHSGPSALFELTLHRYHGLWSLTHRSTVLRILGWSKLNLVSSGCGSRVLGLQVGAATRLSVIRRYLV
ncbi:hypothetical protein R3P38DRAFT_2785584 [Favolaschia claudopus]|uniref:Uncharacterized protein n=1 Tax=Favolaschia claudopus TaxID=2862362 RepID=A0AAW0AUU6_9AGAR